MEELSVALDIPRTTLNMYELNKREPDFTTTTKIADYFNVTLDALLGRVDLGLDKPVMYLKTCKKAESLNVTEEELASMLNTMLKFKGK